MEPAPSAPDEIATVRQLIAGLTAEADAPPALGDQPGKLRTSTAVLGVLMAAAIGLAFLDEPLNAIGIVLAVLFGLLFLARGLGDLTFRSPRGRRESIDAVRCFVQAIRRRRWTAAWTCISPLARTQRPIQVPLLPVLDPRPAEVDFSRYLGVKRYWKALAHADGSITGNFRRIIGVEIRPLYMGDTPVHRHLVKLQFEIYPQWILFGVLLGVLPILILYFITRKTTRLEAPLVVLKHRRQWYVLTGELMANIDRTLPVP